MFFKSAHSTKFSYREFTATCVFLNSQVSRVVKTISNVLKFRTACLTSVSDADSEQRKLRLGTEVCSCK